MKSFSAKTDQPVILSKEHSQDYLDLIATLLIKNDHRVIDADNDVQFVYLMNCGSWKLLGKFENNKYNSGNLIYDFSSVELVDKINRFQTDLTMHFKK